MTRPEPESTGDAERVHPVLAAAPSPVMPPEVAARLDAVLAEESRRRADAARVKGGFVDPRSVLPVAVPARPVLVTDQVPGPPRWRRAAAVTLVAAVTAAAVGIAGYTLSATAGLNEPVANSVHQVRSADLAQQAEAIAASRRLSAHVFSGAWRCARAVTDGRITGLTPAVVDGNPSLLVYTRNGGDDWVTVVTGCPEPGALARESVRITR